MAVLKCMDFLVKLAQNSKTFATLLLTRNSIFTRRRLKSGNREDKHLKI